MMKDTSQSKARTQQNIFSRLKAFIGQACPIPPPTGARLTSRHLTQLVRLSREQFGGLILVLVIASLVLVFALQPRLVFPDYAITGTLTGPVTIWTGHINIESDVIVDGTNTLIIDGAVIHNYHGYDIIVRDAGNLTITHGAMAVSETGGITDNFRVICEDQSVVRVSNSTVGYMWVDNTQGTVLIESGSSIDQFGSSSKTGGVKPIIRDSTIRDLYPRVWIVGNFSLRGSEWSGDVEVMVEVENTSTVEWTHYDLSITDSPFGLIQEPTIKVDYLFMNNSYLTLTNVNYTTLPLEDLLTEATAPTVKLGLLNSTILVEACNLGELGTLHLEGTSVATVTRSVIGRIEAYAESQVNADHVNARTFICYDNAHAVISNSTDRGWVWQKADGQVIDVSWEGIYESVAAYGHAEILLDNVIINQVHYDHEMITSS
jgi:hypothetical protein